MQSLRFARHILPLLALTAAALPAAADDSIKFLDINGATGVNLTFFNGSTYVTDNGVAAGDYHLSINGGPSTTAYCTDLWDDTYVGESWNATEHQTSAADGLVTASAYYSVAPHNINAIDFIGQNYTSASPGQQAAAQLAIWDLIDGGQVTHTGSQYLWSTTFQETSGNVSTSDVYAIEQAALAAQGPQGSVWLKVVDGTQQPESGRPQDFVTAAPEPSSVATFGLAGIGVLGLLLRARKRQPVA